MMLGWVTLHSEKHFHAHLSTLEAFIIRAGGQEPHFLLIHSVRISTRLHARNFHVLTVQLSQVAEHTALL
jgi:hypothetical protein